MSVKQAILRLARMQGLPKPKVVVTRIKGNTFWNLFAENTSRKGGLWGDEHPSDVVGAYRSLEDARENLRGDAQRFIEMVKREALEE